MEGLKLKAIKVPKRRMISSIADHPYQVLEDDDDDDGEPLSPGSRLFIEPDFNIYILFIFTFKTPVNLTVFKNLMTPLIHHPRFSSLLQPVTGANRKFKWVPTSEVDIDDHVIVPELETATAGVSPEEVVNGYISGLSNSVMDMSRPMWEWHVLNVKTSDDAESTAVLRLHHSIGDGVSLMSLLVSLAAGENHSNSPAPEVSRCSRNVKLVQQSGKQKRYYLLHEFMNNYKAGRMLSVVVNTVVSCVMVLLTLLFHLRDTKTPLGPTTSTGVWRSRKFVRKTISLDDVKMIKSQMNVTINDVMLGLVQAGLSRYLQRTKTYGEANKKDATDRMTDEAHQPKNMRVRAIVTMNLRPSSGIPNLSEMLKVNSKVRWGNKIGLVVVPFNIEEKEDVLDYVCESKTSMNKKKVSFEPKISYLLGAFDPSLVPKVCAETTLGFSNITGPSTEITLFGHQVTNIAPTIYGQYPLALVIHVGSYGKKMNIVCSVDDSVISDPHQLCDDLEEAFDTIKKSVMVQSN